MLPIRRIDLAGSVFGSPDQRSRGAFGCVGPLPRAGPHARRTRLRSMLAVQLTKFNALPRFARLSIGRSVERASSVTCFPTLLLALRSVWRNHRQPRAAARGQVLEVWFGVLSAVIGGPS